MSEKKKRYRVLKTLFGLVFVLLCGIAFGQGNYVVKASRLNVRKAASAESAIVGGLQKGDDVYVHSFKGSWAEIDFKGGRAFVSKKYIEECPEPVAEIVAPTEPEPLTVVEEQTPETTKVAVKKEKDAWRRAEALMLAFGGNRSSSYSSFVFTIDYESGNYFATTDAFYTLGLGLYVTKFNNKSSYSSYDALSWGMRIPVHIGYMFGKEDRFHIAARAGVYTDFLFSSKLNKERVKVKFKDRFAWEGGIRITVGYGIFTISGEYLFPFKSSSKGAWMFGFTLGI